MALRTRHTRPNNLPTRLARFIGREEDVAAFSALPRRGEVAAGTTVALRSSQGELAAELGTTRSTLNRAMRRFESFGLNRVDGARIVLDKPDRLAASTW